MTYDVGSKISWECFPVDVCNIIMINQFSTNCYIEFSNIKVCSDKSCMNYFY